MITPEQIEAAAANIMRGLDDDDHPSWADAVIMVKAYRQEQSALEAENKRLVDLSVSQNTNLISATSDIHKLRSEIEAVKCERNSAHVVARTMVANELLQSANCLIEMRQHLHAVCEAADEVLNRPEHGVTHSGRWLRAELDKAKPFLTAGGEK